MPHYKNGREAKVGDHVVGKPYNTPHVVAATVISITPGADSCNCMVQFTQAVPATQLEEAHSVRFFPDERGDGGPKGARLRMARLDADSKPVHRIARGEQHGGAGEEYALVECADYGGVSDFLHVEDLAEASKPTGQHGA